MRESNPLGVNLLKNKKNRLFQEQYILCKTSTSVHDCPLKGVEGLALCIECGSYATSSESYAFNLETPIFIEVSVTS